jgi:hypothetical protein
VKGYNNFSTRHSNLISIEMDWGKLGEAILKNINASTGKNILNSIASRNSTLPNPYITIGKQIMGYKQTFRIYAT